MIPAHLQNIGGLWIFLSFCDCVFCENIITFINFKKKANKKRKYSFPTQPRQEATRMNTEIPTTTAEDYSDIENSATETPATEAQPDYYYTVEEQEAYLKFAAERNSLFSQPQEWVWNTQYTEPGEICAPATYTVAPTTSTATTTSAVRRQRRRRGGVRNRQGAGNQHQQHNSEVYLNNIVASLSNAFYNVRGCRIYPRTIASKIRESLLYNGAMGPDELYSSVSLIKEVCYQLTQFRDTDRYARGQ